MIEVKEAERIILQHCFSPKKVSLPLKKAIGRVLREEVLVDMDFPPFHKVMMDGIAINFQSIQSGKQSFRIVDIQTAGTPQMKLTNPDHCLEAMTGAILPEGCDTVIPYEWLEIDEEQKIARIVNRDVKKGMNIHRKGTDKKKGDLLISPGRRITGTEIALMATVGKTEVEVTQNPKIALVSTGNELVDIDQTPEPHQIRRSNMYGLEAALLQMGLKSSQFHLPDERDIIQRELDEILNNHEVVILSGGVSMGKKDYVPEVLEECGIEKLFHKIKQKPGKPFLFGKRNESNVVFAFPGNPVSTFMCFHRYFKPWLLTSLGIEKQKPIYASLSENFNVKTTLTYFLQVKTFSDPEGKFRATPFVGGGSGDHANLLEVDGFLELPAGGGELKKDEVFTFYPIR